MGLHDFAKIVSCCSCSGWLSAWRRLARGCGRRRGGAGRRSQTRRSTSAPWPPRSSAACGRTGPCADGGKPELQWVTVHIAGLDLLLCNCYTTAYTPGLPQARAQSRVSLWHPTLGHMVTRHATSIGTCCLARPTTHLARSSCASSACTSGLVASNALRTVAHSARHGTCQNTGVHETSTNSSVDSHTVNCVGAVKHLHTNPLSV